MVGMNVKCLVDHVLETSMKLKWKEGDLLEEDNWEFTIECKKCNRQETYKFLDYYKGIITKNVLCLTDVATLSMLLTLLPPSEKEAELAKIAKNNHVFVCDFMRPQYSANIANTMWGFVGWEQVNDTIMAGISDLIDNVHEDCPDCDNCDERMGEPMYDEGRD